MCAATGPNATAPAVPPPAPNLGTGIAQKGLEIQKNQPKTLADRLKESGA